MVGSQKSEVGGKKYELELLLNYGLRSSDNLNIMDIKK
jgi:hypothetical protein